jgi:hypothetical protein
MFIYVLFIYALWCKILGPQERYTPCKECLHKMDELGKGGDDFGQKSISS